MTEVVHVRSPEWRDAVERGEAVYIGRRFAEFPASEWGNPFHMGRDGGRLDVVDKYREWLQGKPVLVGQLPSLEGKTLGCWCAPLPCHGDVLVEALESLKH